MKKHTKIYLEHFDYIEEDFIPCELCENKAVDIHHIEARGMGGSDEKDVIENLMAVCRECHNYFGDKKKFKRLLEIVHLFRLSLHELDKNYPNH
jgi:5-methylcytosine-specific restriction endonuclease McrA